MIIWYERGLALSQLQRWEDANKTYDHVLQHDDNKTVWLNKGVCLSKMGRFQEALECYERATNLDPTYVLAWKNKAVVHRKMGSLDDALQCHERAKDVQNLDRSNAATIDLWVGCVVLPTLGDDPSSLPLEQEHEASDRDPNQSSDGSL